MRNAKKSRPHTWSTGIVQACSRCEWLRRQKMNAGGHAVDTWQYRHNDGEAEGAACQFQTMRHVPVCGSTP